MTTILIVAIIAAVAASATSDATMAPISLIVIYPVNSQMFTHNIKNMSTNINETPVIRRCSLFCVRLPPAPQI